MKLFFLLVAISLLAVGCKSPAIVTDPSTDAFAAGDYTLALSACDSAPGYGFDICRVREGTAIESALVLVVPPLGGSIVAGEADVYYRDASNHKNYALTSSVITIPWADFFSASIWTGDMDGDVLILVSISWKDAQGIVNVAKFRGLAKIVVTAASYDRLPIGSGYQAWSTNCTIQYSTAGRSAISCK